MRHRVGHRKLGRVTEHRIALLRNQAEALLTHEHLTTTLPKAKELRPFVEKLITVAKRGVKAAEPKGRTLAAKRQVGRDVLNPDVVAKLFADLAPRFMERPGGYTRILKLGHRRGDGAETAMVELVDRNSIRRRPRRRRPRPQKRAISRSRRRASASASGRRRRASAATRKRRRPTRPRPPSQRATRRRRPRLRARPAAPRPPGSRLPRPTAWCLRGGQAVGLYAAAQASQACSCPCGCSALNAAMIFVWRCDGTSS